MVLLTPSAAIIGAALALPALIAFYLLKLRRRPVRVSSTMFWVSSTRDLQVNVPFRLVRPSLMLLLQLLILAALLLALARPALPGAGAASSRTILLIDRSASMSARDAGDRSRLDEAIGRATEIIDRTARSGSGASIGVVTFGDRAEVLSGFTSEWRALKRSVRAIEPTDQPGNVSAALELAEALGTRADENDDAPGDPTTVIVISDGGFEADSPLSIAGAQVGFERTGPVPGEGVDNLGITALSVRRDYEDPGLVRLFARLESGAAAPIATSVAVTIDAEVIRRVPLTVPPAGEGAETLSLDIDVPGGALIGVRIERDDVLASDDAAFVTLDPPRTPSILHVASDDAADEPADWILSELLAELAGDAYRRIDLASYRALERSGTIPAASLIVFDRVSPTVLPPTSTITFGARPLLNGVTVVELEAAPTRVLGWRRTHPILRDVSLDGLYVARSMIVALDADTARVESLADGRHGPLIVVQRNGNQHLWVAFEPAQSNWPADPGFVIFVANAVDHMTMRAAAGAGRSFTTVDPVRLRVPGRGTLVVDGPERVTIERSEGDDLVTIGVLDRAGVYTIEGTSLVVPVNLTSSQETRAATAPTIEIGGVQITEGLGVLGATREIWHWFILAAAALLAMEWFWVARLNRV